MGSRRVSQLPSPPALSSSRKCLPCDLSRVLLHRTRGLEGRRDPRTRGATWAAPERPSAGSCSQRPRLQRPSLRDPATGSRPCAPRNGWLWQEQGCHQGHPSRPQSRWPSVHDSGPNGTSSPVEVSGEGCRRNQGTGSVSRGAVTPRGQPWPRAVPEAHGAVLHGGTAQAEGGSWGQSPRGLEFRACVHTRPKA